MKMCKLSVIVPVYNSIKIILYPTLVNWIRPVKIILNFENWGLIKKNMELAKNVRIDWN